MSCLYDLSSIKNKKKFYNVNLQNITAIFFFMLNLTQQYVEMVSYEMNMKN